MIIKNDFLYILEKELIKSDIEEIFNICTYKDLSIDFQIKMIKESRWSNFNKIRELEKELWTTVAKKENIKGEAYIVLPQGLLEYPPIFNILRYFDKKDLRSTISYPMRNWLSEPVPMRYYQEEACKSLEGCHRGQIVAATGSGKSLMIANIIKNNLTQTLVIAPTTLIAEQLFIFLTECFGKDVVGFYGGGKKHIKNITVALYQSLTRAFDNNEEDSNTFKKSGLVICDENQVLGAGSLISIGKHLKDVPIFYSLSATNYRSDGRTLEIYCQSGPVRYSFDTVRAINEGYLAKPYFIVKKVRSETLYQNKMKHDNYISHIIENDFFNDLLIKDIQNYILDTSKPQILILVSEIAHGKKLEKILNIPYVYGETKKPMDIINKFNSGEIPYLIAGSAICGVGVDTRPVDVLFLLSFVVSEGLVTQLLGRGLRKVGQKKSVIIHDYSLVDCEQLRKHSQKRIDIYKQYGEVRVEQISDNDFLAI